MPVGWTLLQSSVQAMTLDRHVHPEQQAWPGPTPSEVRQSRFAFLSQMTVLALSVGGISYQSYTHNGIQDGYLLC